MDTIWIFIGRREKNFNPSGVYRPFSVYPPVLFWRLSHVILTAASEAWPGA
jgi:hypothetical protein